MIVLLLLKVVADSKFPRASEKEPVLNKVRSARPDASPTISSAAGLVHWLLGTTRAPCRCRSHLGLTGAGDIADPERLGSFPRVIQKEEDRRKIKFT